MNILVSTSKSYYRYLVVMLESLYQHHCSGDLTVYVLHSELDPAEVERLEVQASRCKHRLLAVFADEIEFAQLPSRKQWPLVLYYRLKAAELLPSTVDRVLSLDTDVIITDSLGELYRMDMDTKYIAACEDKVLNTARIKTAKGLDPEQTYFNAGVMLLNLKSWRTGGISFDSFKEKLLQPELAYTIPDQDVLNHVLGTSCLIVDSSRFNCSTEELLSSTELQDEARLPTIIHYLRADCKPWEAYVDIPESPLQELWWKYAQATPFYDELKSEFEQRIGNRVIQENLSLKRYYSISLKWIQIEDRQRKMELFFQTRRIHTIAVYGLNVFQEILCADLKSSSIEVKYLIDSYASGSANGLTIRNGESYDDVDCILIAASAHSQKIKQGMRDHNRIILIDELIGEIYRY